MATLKLTLDKRRKYKDGRNPLILRLTAKGESTSIHLGAKLHEAEWDHKKSKILKNHPNHKELNLHIKKELLDYEQKLLVVEVGNQSLKLIDIKNKLIGKSETTNKIFILFANDQIANLNQQNRFGKAQSYQTTINQLKRYKGNQVEFGDVNFTFVKGFELYLSSNRVSVNGIAVYMRALLNLAINSNHYDISNYPFKKFKIRTQKTVSRAIPVESIKVIYDLNLEHNAEQLHARNIFLLIFGLIGISFMDLALLKSLTLKMVVLFTKEERLANYIVLRLL